MRFPKFLSALALTTVCLYLSGCDGAQTAQATPKATDGSAVSNDPVTASVRTVTETATETATEVHTVTETQTVTSVQVHTETQVSTVTVSSVATVTEVQTVPVVTTVFQTVTETVTATSTSVERDIAVGSYSSDTCFLNGLASEGMGQKVYTKVKMHFGKHGRGVNHFELYDDADCRKELSSGKLQIRYTVTKYFDRLLLIAIKQFNDPKNKKDVANYWIPVMTNKEGLLIDIDAAQGAGGPFLEEPSEEKLKSMLDGFEKRAVKFERVKKKSEEEKKKEEAAQVREAEEV